MCRCPGEGLWGRGALCRSLPRAVAPVGRRLCSPGLGRATGFGGGRKGWQGLTAPPFAWLAAGSYLHTTSDLIPARSLQTDRGAHWSPVPCGSRRLLRAQSARESPFREALNPEPGAGAPKAQPPARAVPRCTSRRFRWEEVGPGAKEEQAWGVRLMLIFRMAGRSVCCILSDGICASGPCGSSA